MLFTFGPVPSRRLGRSLGVNNIPPKHCTYACVYCQLGDPQRVATRRQVFHAPEDIVASVRERLSEIDRAGEAPPDFVTIVPDGEPTLDLGLASLIAGLREVVSVEDRLPKTPGSPGSPQIAVITNGSLLPDGEVRRALASADWVSVKLDAADEATWRAIDRPARDLHFGQILSGIAEFAETFEGTLAMETMLVAGLNDNDRQLAALAERVAGSGPDIAYLSWVAPPSEERILAAYRIFADAGITVELNTGFEAGDFSAGSDVAAGILAIGAVHPLEHHALLELLARAGASWSVVAELLDDGRLLEKDYRGRHFYVTRLRGQQ